MIEEEKFEEDLPESVVEEEERNKRPVVVSLLAAVIFINGIMTIINGLGFQAGPVVLLLGGIALLLSLGLWMMWSWAWVGTILLQIGAVGFAVYDWFTGGPIDVLAIALGIIIIIYLLRSEIRAVFFN